MEQKTGTSRKIMKVIVWVLVIAAVLATTHLLVNNFNGLEFFKQLHGG
jgi:hypothetical protein